MYLNEKAIQELYRVLQFNNRQNNTLTETRCISPDSGVINREYQTDIRQFILWCKTYNGRGNLYTGRALRNAFERKSIMSVSTISLDLDPIREKGKASTKEQIDETLAACNILSKEFKGSSLALSGNGCLLLWSAITPILDNLDEFAQHMRSFESYCRSLIKNYMGVRIDNTFDLARLVKIIGTVSIKGECRPTRWLRVAYPTKQSEDVFEFVKSLSNVKGAYNTDLCSKSATESAVFGNGNRNASLTTLAGSLRRRGASYETIRISLLAANKEQCDPPLDDREVEAIAKSVSRYQPASTIHFEETKVVTSNGQVYKLHTPSEGTDSYLDGLKNRGKREVIETPTGIASLDVHTKGLKKGNLYVIGAHPKCGKTTYTLNVVLKLLYSGKSIIYFSTEMNKDDIYDWLFSIATGISNDKFQTGRFSEEEAKSVQSFADSFRAFKFSVFDGFSPNLDMVRAVAKDVKPDIIIFDHLQHIEDGDTTKAVSDFVRGIKNLAMTMNNVAILTSQLRRPTRVVMKDGNAVYLEPTMYDLRGSGVIEQEASAVILLHPTGEYIDSGVRIVKAKLEANRYGPKHEVFLNMHEATTTFSES